MTTKNFKTLFTENILHNGDTVEWCPIPPYQNHLVCGTYQHYPEMPTGTRKRTGTILLFSVNKDELKLKESVETGAVLDIKWCPVPLHGNIAFAVANGDGEVCVYYLSDEHLKFVTKISLHEGTQDYLILSLDWSKNLNKDMICCSDSSGCISVLKFECGELMKLMEWSAHPAESWTTCFDSSNPDIIYSGGDDCKLNVWDIRCTKPTKAHESNTHKAGVTALGCHPSLEYRLCSGSYDETILFWDTRNWSQPTRKIGASGGLWRLKWKPVEETHYLLAACTHAGVKIFHPSKPSCIGRYEEHESMAYGADWCYLEESDIFGSGQHLVASCSFYDQKLCISIWDKNIPFKS